MSKFCDLLHKLRSEATFRQMHQILKIIFRLNRSNKSETVSLFEEMFQHSSDFVFILNRIWTSLLIFQRLLKVIFRLNIFSISINQIKSKISEKPQKERRFLINFLSFAVIVQYLSGKLRYYIERIERILVNTSNRVIDEIRGQEHCKEKYFMIVFICFFRCSESFTIQH